MLQCNFSKQVSSEWPRQNRYTFHLRQKTQDWPEHNHDDNGILHKWLKIFRVKYLSSGCASCAYMTLFNYTHVHASVYRSLWSRHHALLVVTLVTVVSQQSLCQRTPSLETEDVEGLERLQIGHSLQRRRTRILVASTGNAFDVPSHYWTPKCVQNREYFKTIDENFFRIYTKKGKGAKKQARDSPKLHEVKANVIWQRMPYDLGYFGVRMKLTIHAAILWHKINTHYFTGGCHCQQDHCLGMSFTTMNDLYDFVTKFVTLQTS